MSIFYNVNGLRNAMLINLSNHKVNRIENFEDYTMLYHDDELVGINIFNVAKDLNNLPNGMLYPTPDILQFIQSRVGMDLSHVLKPTFVVAEIIECEDVPNTHLHKCLVNVGSENLQIVCGAINARTGLKTVCAMVGTTMPDGNYIADGALMSIASHGMLCSAKELNLEAANPGIIELDPSAIIGSAFTPVFKNL